MKKCNLVKLKEHLSSYRIPKYSTIIIHSSLFRLGIIEGGVNSIVNLLKETFDETFTIVLPTFTWKYGTTREWSYHDSKSEVGVLSEKIRTLKGSLRSIHPFHSVVAYGPNAEYLTNSICKSSFGPNSAFEKLLSLNSYNLSLGSEFIGGATFCHAAEEILKVPYRFYKDFPGKVRNSENNLMDITFNMYVRIIEQSYEYVNTWDKYWNEVLDNRLAKYNKFNDTSPIFLMKIKDCHDFLCDKISKDPYYAAQKINKTW